MAAVETNGRVYDNTLPGLVRAKVDGFNQPRPPRGPWETEVESISTHIRKTKPQDLHDQNRWATTEQWVSTLPDVSPHIKIQAAFDLLADEDRDVVNAGLTMLGAPEVAETILINSAHYQRALHGYSIRIPQTIEYDIKGKELPLSERLKKLKAGSAQEFAIIRSIENVLLLEAAMSKEHPHMSLRSFLASHITAEHTPFLQKIAARPEMEGTLIQQTYFPDDPLKYPYA